MVSVNGNPNWEMRSATGLNDLYTRAVVAASHGSTRTLKAIVNYKE